jgi:hypothetical protein
VTGVRNFPAGVITPPPSSEGEFRRGWFRAWHRAEEQVETLRFRNSTMGGER